MNLHASAAIPVKIVVPLVTASRTHGLPRYIEGIAVYLRPVILLTAGRPLIFTELNAPCGRSDSRTSSVAGTLMILTVVARPTQRFRPVRPIRVTPCDLHRTPHPRHALYSRDSDQPAAGHDLERRAAVLPAAGHTTFTFPTDPRPKSCKGRRMARVVRAKTLPACRGEAPPPVLLPQAVGTRSGATGGPTALTNAETAQRRVSDEAGHQMLDRSEQQRFGARDSANFRCWLSAPQCRIVYLHRLDWHFTN